MIPLDQILNLERTLYLPVASSKKRVFDMIAETFALSDPLLKQTDVFDCLIARERLGPTVIGDGVAIPHGRLNDLVQPQGCFILLKEGVDFDLLDNPLVDILFALIVPKEIQTQHLDVLSSIANLLRQELIRQKIRQSSNRENLYQVIIHG